MKRILLLSSILLFSALWAMAQTDNDSGNAGSDIQAK